MCEFCRANKEALDHANGHIASLLDAMSIASGSMYEISEPYIIGGPNGVYTCISPFLYGSEWKLDSASSGASASQILISSSNKVISSMPDLTGANGVTYSGASGLDGFMVNVASNSSTPVDSEWYNVRNSEGILFVVIVNGANAAYANIVFRQKRKK